MHPVVKMKLEVWRPGGQTWGTPSHISWCRYSFQKCGKNYSLFLWQGRSKADAQAPPLIPPWCLASVGWAAIWPLSSFSLLFRIHFNWKQLPDSCRVPLSKDVPLALQRPLWYNMWSPAVCRAGCELIISIFCNRKWSQSGNSARLAWLLCELKSCARAMLFWMGFRLSSEPGVLLGERGRTWQPLLGRSTNTVIW